MVNIFDLLSSSKRIAIIEPHYDDAWINLGGFILKNPDKQFTIISASFDTNNLNETRFLEKHLPNVKTIALFYKGIHWDKRFELREEEYKDFFIKLNRLNNYKNFEDRIFSVTESFDLVLLPFGHRGPNSFHPQHILISKLKVASPVLFYVEFPYFYGDYQNPGDFFKNFFGFDISDVVKQKVNIFLDVYNSQKSQANIRTKVGKLDNLYEEVLVEK